MIAPGPKVWLSTAFSAKAPGELVVKRSLVFNGHGNLFGISWPITKVETRQANSRSGR